MTSVIIKVKVRDAHFLEENQETGNRGPGNFLQEMRHQENQEKRGKKSSFLTKKPSIYSFLGLFLPNFFQNIYKTLQLFDFLQQLEPSEIINQS